MNTSDIFSGDSLANKYEDGATYKSDALASAGIILTVAGEKGFFSITDSSSGANTVAVRVDGKEMSVLLSNLINMTVNPNSTTVGPFEYKKSLEVEITSYSSGSVTVSRVS